MIVLIAFAFLSGIVTILSPCILPVLPIVLAGGIGKGKARPFGVVVGFAASFSFFTLALASLVQAFNIPPDALRALAVVLIAFFGLVLLLPALTRIFESLLSRLVALTNKARASDSSEGGPRRSQGFPGGFVLGLGLGLVWTPCVGPIMASVISLALTRRVDGGSVLITIAYALGTSLPMFAVMMGGRAALNRVPWLLRRALLVQRVFGIVMIAVAAMIGFGLDRRFQATLLAAFPSYGSGLTALEGARPVQDALKARAAVSPSSEGAGTFSAAGKTPPEGGLLGDYGGAPPFVAEGPWYNTGTVAPGTIPSPSAPLDLAALRGKVVLVDFWTYSCVNCIRTLPYLKAWYKSYKDKGLVVIGVHSPEFEFEKLPSNVAAAIRDLGVTWPVVMDDDYALWNAYGNQYWPAHYFIDAKGRLRYFHFGEGDYDTAEKVIRELLSEAGVEPGAPVAESVAAPEAGTPETYLGYERGSGLDSAVTPVGDKMVEYRPTKTPASGQWSLEGRWTISSQYIYPESRGTLRLGFRAKDVFLVVEPEGAGGSISVSVDGVPITKGPDFVDGMLRPTESRLYRLVELPSVESHVLTLLVRGKLRLFAFTFG